MEAFYIDRMMMCGLNSPQAWAAYNNFARERDYAGLAKCVEELERMHGLASVQP